MLTICFLRSNNSYHRLFSFDQTFTISIAVGHYSTLSIDSGQLDAVQASF